MHEDDMQEQYDMQEEVTQVKKEEEKTKTNR